LLHVYRLHAVSELYRACDKRRLGVLECSIDEIALIEQARASKQDARSNLTPKRTAVTALAAPAEKEPLPELPKVPLPHTATFTPFLRA
jgi:hypothetical protein